MAIPKISPIETVTLSQFPQQQDENPVLVSDLNDQVWVFILRRLPFPAEKEVICGFRRENHTWQQLPDLTPEPGEFETLAAACAPDGLPIVAWTAREKGSWQIKVTRAFDGKFVPPETAGFGHGRAINPVLIAPEPARAWLAWESYEKGKFKICLREFRDNQWGKIICVTDPARNSYDPALAEFSDGKLAIVYSVAEGMHRNIEMKIFDPENVNLSPPIAVAIGGPFTQRVNMNTHPTAAFDSLGRLWISWENNRDFSRRNDSDGFAGSRTCPVVCYHNNKIQAVEGPGKGKWLFRGSNDHRPRFASDHEGRLFLFTRSGGTYQNDDFWRFRFSWLDPQTGWREPQTLLETTQKGATEALAVAFLKNESFWFAYRKESYKDLRDVVGGKTRENQIDILQFNAPSLASQYTPFNLVATQTETQHPVNHFEPVVSGRLPVPRRTLLYQGETFTLLLGNLHEHTEISWCWPAGTDGTFDDNYRYGRDAEGYDFMALTDHDEHFNEVSWRRYLRWAEFYNAPEYFIALPAVEWALSTSFKIEGIIPGSGHRNIIFETTADARKYLRNQRGLFSMLTPETNRIDRLWQTLREKKIKAVTIPHHPADDMHPVSWEFHDPGIEPVVEIFQCRGNGEYPGCPWAKRLPRHNPTIYKEAFVDYALRERKYKLGFVASGDHNATGVGLAAVWVKEISRAGILEALKARRCFATTGDKIFLDFRINDQIVGATLKTDSAPKITFHVEAVQPIRSIEILRNSRVVKEIFPSGSRRVFEDSWIDTEYLAETGVCYYYLRITQENLQMAWSGPIWFEG